MVIFQAPPTRKAYKFRRPHVVTKQYLIVAARRNRNLSNMKPEDKKGALSAATKGIGLIFFFSTALKMQSREQGRPTREAKVYAVKAAG